MSLPVFHPPISWIAGENGSTITSEGTVGEGYGKVYLTHNFTVGSDDYKNCVLNKGRKN